MKRKKKTKIRGNLFERRVQKLKNLKPCGGRTGKGKIRRSPLWVSKKKETIAAARRYRNSNL